MVDHSRVFQGIGAAFLVANSAAILTEAFSPNQRGLALGITILRAYQRFLHRPDPQGLAGGHSLAAGVSGVDALRAFRHRVVLPQAAGSRAAAPCQDRLGRQYQLRCRADTQHDRHHLRHPTGRWPSHGLDQHAGTGAAGGRRASASAARLTRPPARCSSSPQTTSYSRLRTQCSRHRAAKSGVRPVAISMHAGFSQCAYLRYGCRSCALRSKDCVSVSGGCLPWERHWHTRFGGGW